MSLCRSFALQAGSGLFSEPVGEGGPGIVNDQVNRTQIEIDISGCTLACYCAAGFSDDLRSAGPGLILITAGGRNR